MSIVSGEIQAGRLYKIYSSSSGSLTYNGGTLYVNFPGAGGYFEGTTEVTTFTTTGDITVEEILELKGGTIEYVGNGKDAPDEFDEITEIRGFATEYDLNEDEKIVQETTEIQGFAIEFIDYPFYSFAITETRL